MGSTLGPQGKAHCLLVLAQLSYSGWHIVGSQVPVPCLLAVPAVPCLAFLFVFVCVAYILYYLSICLSVYLSIYFSLSLSLSLSLSD
jgi:hypothetical protein